MIVTKNKPPPKTAPQGSCNAFSGSLSGVLSLRGIIPSFLNTTHLNRGNRTIREAIVGNAVQAENCRKEIPNADVRTRFVGLEETSKADTRLAVWNCVNKYAVESGIWANREKWAKKGVPDRIKGSFPTIRPKREKNEKKDMYSLRPEEADFLATIKARYRSRLVRSRESAM
jgi:hypothetical protein